MVGRKSFLTIKQNARSPTDSDSSVGALSETRSIRVSLSFDLIKMMIVATLLIDKKTFWYMDPVIVISKVSMIVQTEVQLPRC